MLERASIFHRPTDQYAYPFQQDSLHIRIQTKKDNVASIELIYGDQYEWQDNRWVTYSIPLIRVASDGLFDYWQVEVSPPYQRLRYGFHVHGETESVIYTEKGYFNEPPHDPNQYFCFPYLHSNEVFRAPAWVRDTIWYQIFPERFANGDSRLNPLDTKPWGSEDPTAENFFGGDFIGIIQKLDYLKELGINGIYLTPIFKAYSNHKYDTIDYFEIDPQFGDKQTFKRLVKTCHEKGIRVMLDAVFNHCGFYFPPFQDVWKNGVKSPYKNWFHTEQFPLRGGEHPNYATFSFVETMPKLNTQNKDTRDYLLEVGRYWVKEFDIDAWRLDVANEIDHAFWRKFREAVKEIKPELYILGEIWHDSIGWLRGDQFDSVMNYPFLTKTVHYFAKGLVSPREFREQMTAVMMQYPETVNETLFNLVGSHDTPRILTECEGNIGKAKLIYTFLLTFIGTPCIYYGDEIGLTGEMDPGCRRCMIWEKDQQNLELYHHIKQLIQLRKKEPLLANQGKFHFLPIENGIAYVKEEDERKCLVIINPSAEVLKLTLPFPLKGRKIVEILKNHEYMMESEELFTVINPFDSAILLFHNG
ncbi:glycoside hydrolase family 13 protein [Bacillus tuaregi]|uniref:glycoside hydrolase family 13 protein n=1 Tax=Bacillus tuaregi TaxID=1816695 RepID=UPI0008F88F84|nr:glycoside hydrolase family 13 protein [Bacillus tuaregi]